MRRGLIVAGVPALLGCNNGRQCFGSAEVAWDGKLEDGGQYETGTPEGAALCHSLCPMANRPSGGWDCWPAGAGDAGLLVCGCLVTGGRSPPGFLTLSMVDGSAGSWVARMAEFETAAVAAFAQLADELDAHGLERYAHHARQAALDEVRHSDAVTRLALRLGHCPAPVKVSATHQVRSLEEIALDNASEGCGRELFGAVMNQ